VTSQALLDRQHELEADMRNLGSERFEKMIADARAGKRESETPYGAALLRDAVLPLADRIGTFLAEAKGKNSVHTAVPYLLTVDNNALAAYVTAKKVLDSISKHTRPLRETAKAIAKGLEDEVRMRYFESENKGLFRFIKKKLDKQSKHENHRKKVLVAAMGRDGKSWEGWPLADLLHLGCKLIELFIEVTGFVVIEQDFKGPKDSPQVLRATPEVLSWISAKNASGSLLQPELFPMLVPPKDWTTPWDGGYLKPIPNASLIKIHDRMVLEDYNSIDMPKVYQTVNAVQKTAWQVNTEVLMVLRELWDSGVCVGDTPSKVLRELPPKPADIDTNAVAKKQWKYEARDVRTHNIKQTSRIIQVARTIAIADRFQSEEAIYFPHQLDFRGRLYAVPMFLNPQGPDYAKALLRFSEGKPLGSQEAVDWLAVHGANCFGVDKVSYEDRVQWVLDHQDQIILTAENPLDERWWTKADSPWQFLAFCFEWYGYTIHGLEFSSKIPVGLDGSCNGLQHFSAMLRDEVGGKATNLVPSDKPSDIYQMVADKVNQSIKGDTSAIAIAWKKVGVTRKATKRCVMTLPYGATEFAFKEFVKGYVLENGAEALFGESHKDYSAYIYMAKQINKALKGTVTKAMEAMNWLQMLAGMACEHRTSLHWVTPAGFPVIQQYANFKSKQVSVYLTGKRISFRVNLEEKTVDKKRQQNGCSPNFVHSMDAAALMLTVCKAAGEGIGAFSMVHDSYGTHAADTAHLAQILRDAFVTMYEEHDVLKEFQESVAGWCGVPVGDLPEPPSRGSLELGGIFSSKYFFS
jgi:DNA-directed RNA polymerase